VRLYLERIDRKRNLSTEVSKNLTGSKDNDTLGLFFYLSSVIGPAFTLNTTKKITRFRFGMLFRVRSLFLR
jgi:hypothetical protein